MGSKSPPPPPKVWQSQNLDGADQGVFGKIQGFGNTPNYAAQTYSQAQPAFQGAFKPGGYDPSQTVNYGNYLSQQGQQFAPYAQQAMDQGFDPQNSLYGRTAHNLEQQTRRALEARGVNDTPYGAAVEGQNMANFNLDWNDRALGRQAQGAQTAMGIYGQGAQQIGQGQQMAQGVPSWQAQMLNTLQGAGVNNTQIPQQAIQQYLAYMQAGMGGDQNALNRYQGQLKQYELQQQNSPWNTLGTLAGLGVKAYTGGMFG